jgi:hypothetical protein
MNSRSSEFLERLAHDTTTGLFAAYGLTLERRPFAPVGDAEGPDVSCGGVIGFRGQDLTGSLLVVGNFALLSACRPQPPKPGPLSMSSASDWLLVRDWSMELANQLLGRMRNRLREYGIEVQVRLPTAVSGYPLAVSIRSRTSTPLQFATSSKQMLRLWFDAAPGPGFEAAIKSKVLAALPKEGDVLLF